MIKSTVIRSIGKSSGVVIPKVMLANLGIGEGDTCLPSRWRTAFSLRRPFRPRQSDGSFSRWNEALQECDEGTGEQVTCRVQYERPPDKVAVVVHLLTYEWSRRDSNPGPLVCETSALTS